MSVASSGLTHSWVPCPRGPASHLEGRSASSLQNSRCAEDALAVLGLDASADLRPPPHPGSSAGVAASPNGASHAAPPPSFPASSPVHSLRGAPFRSLKRHSATDSLAGAVPAVADRAGGLPGASPGANMLFWGSGESEDESSRFPSDLGTGKTALFPMLSQVQLSGSDGAANALDTSAEWNLLLRAELQSAMDNEARVHLRAMREDQKAALRNLLTLRQHTLQAQLERIEKLLATLYRDCDAIFSVSDVLALIPDVAPLVPAYPARSPSAGGSSAYGTARCVSPHHPPGTASHVDPLRSPSPSKSPAPQMTIGILGLSTLRGPASGGTSGTVGTESTYATPKSQRGSSMKEDGFFFSSTGSPLMSNHQPGQNEGDCLRGTGKESGAGLPLSGVCADAQQFHRRNSTRSRTAPTYTLDNLAVSGNKSLFSLICDDAGRAGSTTATLADALREGHSVASGASSGAPALPTGASETPLFQTPASAAAQQLAADVVASDALASLVLKTRSRLSALELRDRRVRFDEEHREPMFQRHNTRSASLGASRVFGGQDFLMSSVGTALAAAAAAAEAADAQNEEEFLIEQGACQLGTSERAGNSDGAAGVVAPSPGSPVSLQNGLPSPSVGSALRNASSGGDGTSRSSGGAWEALNGSMTTQAGETSGGNVAYARPQRRTVTLPGSTKYLQLQSMDVQCLLHLQGRCKPCAFYYNRKGCRNGVNCEFCHHEVHSKLTLKQWKKQQHKLSKQGRVGLGTGEDDLVAVAAAAAASRPGGLRASIGTAAELIGASPLSTVNTGTLCPGSVGGSGSCEAPGVLEDAVMRTLFGNGDISRNLPAFSLVGENGSATTGRDAVIAGLELSDEGTSGPPPGPASRLRAALASAESARAAAAAAVNDGDYQCSSDGGSEVPGRSSDECVSGSTKLIYSDMGNSACGGDSGSAAPHAVNPASPGCHALLRRI
uniref:C3H1-type domain-containing protein n=1 Tax=Neospora caninum (strain Liverpool) TaxID=572307 RepID=A0A0F7UHN0_NEOCL|nr:TPA: hypothetical protein BN1204_042990 [Neospora caninum Liverpool]